MKKILTILAIGLLMQLQSFGHAWTVHRTWCGGFFHKKFQAYAQTSAWATTKYQSGYDLNGRWVGTQPIVHWYTLCDHNDKGCSRPRVADCNNSGYMTDYLYSGPYLLMSPGHYYNAHARAAYLTSGTTLTQTTSGRGHAGAEVGDYVVDSTIFSQLDTTGFSNTDITSDSMGVSDAGQITIQNLNGNISIGTATDYCSKFKVVIIKERDDISDTEAGSIDSLMKLGIFENAVDSGAIYVSNGKIVKSGIFEDLSSTQCSELRTPDSFGVNLHSVSLSKTLSMTPLSAHEHLSFVSIVDGGFDISSAVISRIEPPVDPMNLTIAVNNEQDMLYPNPVSKYLNYKVYSESEAPISIKAFDLLGREIRQIYSGTLQKGFNTIENIDVSNLPKNVLMLQINIGGKISNRKLLIK
jgi:hypothetical protein